MHLLIEDEHYALPVENVLEVSELDAITGVPAAPPAVLGVVNRDGEVLVVIDLASVLGKSRAAKPDASVVVEDGARRASLAVDRVLNVEPTPELTEATPSSLLSGAALVNGQLLGMLDVGALLDAGAQRAGVNGH